MPERGELPEKLADLASRQAITLDHESFGADCTRLIEIIESLAGEQQVKEVDLWADPDYPAARSALLQGQWARAIEGLERVLRRHPRHQQVLDQLAEARRRQSLIELDQRARDAAVDGRWGVAVEALEGIHAIEPSDAVAERLAEARQQMRVRSLQQDVRALAELGDWAAVLAADTELTALDPRSADIDGLATRARLQLLEGRLDADYRRGLRQLDASEWEAGEATFAALLELRPGYRDAEALLEVARRRGAAVEPEEVEDPVDTGPLAVVAVPVVEPTVQEPTGHDPVEETVEEPVEEPVEAVEEPVEEPIDQTVEEPVEEPVDDAVGTPSDPPPPLVVPPPPPPPRRPETSDGAAARRISLRAWVGAVVAAVVLVGVVVIGLNLAGGDDPEAKNANPEPSASGVPTPSASAAGPAPAAGDELVAAPGIAIAAPPATMAMGGKTAGVQVDGLADVETFGTGDEAHSAPEGGRLRAFHLSSWTCDVDNCKDWSKLDLRVVVDGDSRRLPDTQGSYVVAIPAGAAEVDLVMKADDVRQSLSLLTGAPGPDNISVLARHDRFVEISESFRLTETTTIELDYGDGHARTSAVRDVDVESARLGYFVAGRRPGSADKAFLVFDATFTRPYGNAERHPVKAADMRFIVDGKTYEAIDIEDAEVEVKNAAGAFEVPASVTGGTLVIGGRPRDAEATDGTPYVVTLQAHEIELSFS
jgi:tetratricopeptide (TPR) repeat protein